MPNFVPVDGDPFAAATSGVKLVPVDHDPFASTASGIANGRKLVPVDGDPFEQQPSTAMDVAKSTGSGLVRGATELAMSPLTFPKMAAGAVMDATEWLARRALGLGDPTPETQALRERAKADTASSFSLQSAISSAASAVRGAEDQVLHKPETTAGKFAGTVAEMVPAVLAGPGGLARAAGREALAAVPGVAGKAWEAAKPLLTGAVAPGLASEAAGEWAANAHPDYEGAIRFAGGLAGNVAGAAPGYMHRAADYTLARGMAGTAPADFQAAQALQERAAAIGVPLSGPEAIQAVTGGATKLGDLQRVVEGSTAGGARTAQFYAQRPDQVADAAGRAFDQIAPAPTSAAAAGLAGQQAAENALQTAERFRTDRVTPHFDAADAARVSPADMDALHQDMAAAISADRTGVTAGEVARLRDMLVDQPAQPAVPGTPATRTPVLGPNGQVIRYDATPATPGAPGRPMVPVTGVENLNRARKAMRERLDMPLAPGRDPITAEQQHAVGPFMDRLSAMMSDASPSYTAGNQVYGEISDQLVNPLRAGPVGAIARTSDLGEQGRALLPDVPAEGAATDARIAAALLADHDPAAAATIVRNRLGQQFAEATQQNVGGSNQWGGAKFAANVVGNPLQEDVLRAAFGALPRGEANARQFDQLVEAFRATGQRKPQGSATEFNRQAAASLSHQGVAGAAVHAAATGGLGLGSLFGQIGEAARLHALDRNSARAAELMLAPNSATQLGAIARRATVSPLAELFARQGMQSGNGR